MTEVRLDRSPGDPDDGGHRDAAALDPSVDEDPWATRNRTAEAAAADAELQQSVGGGEPPLSARRRFLRRFKRQRAAVAALLVLLVMVALALLAPVLAPAEPEAQNLRRVLVSPDGTNLLGTDDVGRDVLSRMLYAARISLAAAVQAILVGGVLGIVPGLLAGYVGRWADAVFTRISDTIMSFPPLILAIAIVGVLGPGLRNAMIAVGMVFAPRFFRVVRGASMAVREETYIEAARGLGCTTWTIVRRHVLPNVLSPLLVTVSLAAGSAMLAEAGLSFLGLGVQPPQASWGAMLGRAFRYFDRAPWLVFFPGIAIAVCVLAFNILGDGLRDSIGRETRRGS